MSRGFASRSVVLALTVAAHGGCKGEPTRDDAAASDGQAAPAAQGREVDSGMRHCEEATRNFLDKLSERYAQGWPDSLKMTDDAPAKPLVRIDVVNRTSGSLDKDAWAGHIADQLLAQDVVTVTGVPAGAPVPPDANVVECVVSDERRQADGVMRVDTTVRMTLSPSSGPPVVVSISRFSVSRER